MVSTTSTSRRPLWSALSLLASTLLASSNAQVSVRIDTPKPWINEFHYDNIGNDVNEFIEVAVPDGFDISTYQVILYNGFFGYMYKENATHPLTTFTKGDSINGVTFYTKFFSPAVCSGDSDWCGLQNGRDGMVLANFLTPTSGQIEEFISYEGFFTAKDGPAANITSWNIGVKQRTTTPIGYTISRQGIGCLHTSFYYEAPDTLGTPGTMNANQTVTCEVAFINEFHYDNSDGGVGQFVEVAANVDQADLVDLSVVLYNGEDGLPYETLLLSDFEVGDTDPEGLTFYYYDFPVAGGGLMVNDPIVVDGTETAAEASGMALVKNNETVLEFISYGGSFEATGGVAAGLTSTDIGVSESEKTPVGSSLQLQGTGCYTNTMKWVAVEAQTLDVVEGGDTRGAANLNQNIVCQRNAPTPAPTTLEEGVDDLIAEDDDFLDDNIREIPIVNVERTVTYQRGADPAKALEGMHSS